MLKHYRETATVDFSLIDAAASQGHPWIGTCPGTDREAAAAATGDVAPLEKRD